jgi:hypothetical protein
MCYFVDLEPLAPFKHAADATGAVKVDSVVLSNQSLIERFAHFFRHTLDGIDNYCTF